MTVVKVDPGICGFLTRVESIPDEDLEMVSLDVRSGCEAVRNMMQDLGSEFDSFECCLVKPGCDPFSEYAQEHFPGHASCPIISGILKCIEVSCNLALPKDVSITFEKEEV
ncbi:MAG TPA: hypothetical protein GX717_02345 [Clostridiaceae bacterium]|nr:hypothetical protein [Clostridiaceae bacterium]